MSAAFVAGASGYTGRAVAAELARRGQHAVAHVRPDSPSLESWRARFAALGAHSDATPWDATALRATLAGLQPSLVFALLGTTRKRARRDARQGRDSSYEAVDYGLTMLLLEATQAAAPRARFVYLSSLGASATARSEYLRVRGRVERAIETSALDFIIAQPSFITGPDRDERRPAERAAAKAVDAVLGIVARLGARRPRERYGSLTGEQLAAGLVALALDPHAGRKCYRTAAIRAAADA